MRQTLLPGILIALTGCALHTTHVGDEPAQSLAVTTAGPNRSTIYLERVEGGIVVIDLGWWGAERALDDALRRMGASASDVVAVFLTHSHRDHVAAWRAVRHAPFHVAEPEVNLLLGHGDHAGWIPRLAEKLKGSDLPEAGDVVIHPFRADTVFTFGRDTVRAFAVSGHTAGSAAYLVRGRLFAGDAISHTWWSGFRPALGGYSDDTDEAKRSIASLRQRLRPFAVTEVCTAHFQCSPATDEFWADVIQRR
jgi:glyoxylase-like metal-dependent hydrolase (beta-lactamase superfamily II)